MKLSELLIEPEVTLELAPLIDVLFLIVLFYAVSSSLITPEELARLKGQLATAVTENHTLIEKVETEAAQLAQVRIDLDRRGEDVTNQNARIGELQSDLRASAAMLTQRGADVADALKRVDQLQGDLALASRKIGERDSRLADQATRLGRLESDLKTSTDQLAQRNAEVTDTRTRLTRVQSDLALASGQVSERDARMAEQAVRLDHLQSDLTAKEQALANQAQRIVIMSQALDDVRSKLARSQEAGEQQAQQASQAQAAVSRLETESRQLADDLKTEKAGHEADLAAVKAELDRLRIQVTELSTENAKFAGIKKDQLDRATGLDEAQQRLKENLKTLIEDKSLGVEKVNDRLVLELSDKILFDSGSDQLRNEGLPVLANVAKVLGARVQGTQIQVGGHTDNVPLGTANRFGSNWALSAARAVNVVRFLESAGGIDPSRLSAVGYGEYQPIAANALPEGRAKNRRIEIVLLAK